MAAEEAEPVDLYIYDLSHGLATMLSPAILGEQIEGVWHTSVVVYGKEYFFGADGITSCHPGGTQLGPPLRKEHLGETQVPLELLIEFLQGLSNTSYTGQSYNLLDHNCNNFSDELVQFLCGARVPKYILDLPTRALPPPLAAAIRQLLPLPGQSVYGGARGRLREDSPDFLTLNTQIEQARLESRELEQRRSTLAEKTARQQRKRDKKRKKHGGQHHDDDDEDSGDVIVVMSEAVAGGSASTSDADERSREEELRRQRDPPIVFRDIDGVHELEQLDATLKDVELSPEEKQCLEELKQYVIAGEGSWVLGDNFMEFIGRLVSDPSLPCACRTLTMRVLCACALKDDVSLLLHGARRHRALQDYIYRIDRLSLEEQLAIATFLCNLCESPSSSEWLLYISEWECDGQPLSNIRVTTKVAVHSLLSEDPELRERGTALMYNVSAKEVKTVVFDDVCVELCMALLQYASNTAGGEQEEQLYRVTAALARLAARCRDVPQLLALVPLQHDQIRGTSPRVDEQLDILMKVQ